MKARTNLKKIYLFLCVTNIKYTTFGLVLKTHYLVSIKYNKEYEFT